MAHWARQNIMVYVLNARKRWPTCPFVYLDFQYIQKLSSLHQVFEKTINVQLTHHPNNPVRFELVKTYQVHVHSRIF